MQSLSILAWSTGFIDDSETSSIIDQYGPSRASVDLGLVPSASCMVGNFFEVAGWLLGE